MATDPSTVAFILEQGQAAGVLTARKMFGEYGLYLDDKIVGLICDDQIYIKVTEAGRKLLQDPVLAPAYPGAKPSYQLGPEFCEDADHFVQLLKATYAELPKPKEKKHGS